MATDPPNPAPSEADLGKDTVEGIGRAIQSAYDRNRRVMSFETYLAEALRKPERHARSAAQYLKDVFDYFGTVEVKSPRGTLTRHRLFDVPFDGGRDRLIGQEEVQGRVYRIICNFVREGAINKLILLHGPNGSAKSTLVSCLMRALEHYSALDEGAIYKINWIFPSQKLTRGGIGFSGDIAAAAAAAGGSFALLDDELVDARIGDEVRDHPLLLLPLKQRQELLDERLGAAKSTFTLSDYLRFGDLSPKNKQVFEALLAAYKGDYAKVLRHVQVERFYLSRRYRAAAVTVEPQLAVDAHARQLTMSRSFTALPSALQALSLYEYGGELVDANRGMIEYADLLKRPLEAYKYLLGTVEHGSVHLENTILHLDTIFIGASNESHLAVFKEIPEFQSFKGRLELLRMPYLLDYLDEQKIYEEQVSPTSVDKHIAPHTAYVAALWAVLTRMRKPLPEKYGKPLSELVGKLAPLDKAELYSRGIVPAGLSADQCKELVSNIDKIFNESDAYPNYEGRTGASPREMRTLVLNAAQNSRWHCLSPFGVLDEIEELIKNVSVYEFLKQEPLPGGYHENKKFVGVVQGRLADLIEDEVRSSVGLVEEKRYGDLLARYIANVSHWTKKERLRNPSTGRLDDPDEELMSEVERTLSVQAAKRDEHRREVIAQIGAWSIEHPGQKLDLGTLFGRQLQLLRESYFVEQKKLLKKTNEDLLVYLAEGKERSQTMLEKESFERVEVTIGNLTARFGYCAHCAKDAVSFLLRKRF